MINDVSSRADQAFVAAMLMAGAANLNYSIVNHIQSKSSDNFTP